jgi:multiple sugar transport system permease protein
MRDPAWWRVGSLAPALLLFVLLTALPFAMLLALSLHDIAWTSTGVRWSFTGLQHFLALPADVLLRASVVNTLVFALLGVSLQMVFGLGLALLTSGIARGQTAYRMVFLLPILIPGIVIGAIWKLMFGFDFGIINIVLDAVGLPPQDWLGDRGLALGSIIAVDIWHWTPFCYLLLLAGLESLPRDVFEAARIDGAGRWQTLRHVILPLLAPTIAVTFIFRLILAFKVFDEVYFLTGGGPGTATEVLSFTIYRRFFTEDRAGYGAAMSVATFVLVAVLVLGVASAGRRRTA